MATTKTKATTKKASTKTPRAKKNTTAAKKTTKKATAKKKTATQKSTTAASKRKSTTASKTSPKGKARSAAKKATTAKSSASKAKTKNSPKSSKKKAGDQLVTVDRRTKDQPVAKERRKVEPREKVTRRRQIDPTTCERDYSNDEVEFMNALEAYKRANGRPFPTCSEILEVIRGLGYSKPVEGELLDPSDGESAFPELQSEGLAGFFESSSSLSGETLVTCESFQATVTSY